MTSNQSARSTSSSTFWESVPTVSTNWRPSSIRSASTIACPSSAAGASSVSSAATPFCPPTPRTSFLPPRSYFSKPPASAKASAFIWKRRIPIAAGLGGGSGNAATTLLAMNELFGQPLSRESLLQLAASLGSDVPFFLQNRPALATGRGELITPIGFLSRPGGRLDAAGPSRLWHIHPVGLRTTGPSSRGAPRKTRPRPAPDCPPANRLPVRRRGANSTTPSKRPPCSNIRCFNYSRNFSANTALPPP